MPHLRGLPATHGRLRAGLAPGGGWGGDTGGLVKGLSQLMGLALGGEGLGLRDRIGAVLGKGLSQTVGLVPWGGGGRVGVERGLR